jgi:hypothetical protein
MIPRRLLALVAAALIGSAGCAGAAAPASFDPSAPCAGADEQRMAGAFPELEGTIPASISGVSPSALESGRYCSKTSLGALAETGIAEARFGAGTWDHGGGKGVSLVTFEADGLTAKAMYDSYLAGARADTAHVHDIVEKDLKVGDLAGYRLDFLNGESFQRILVWPGPRDGQVRVVLAADLTDAEIQAAVDAFG